VAIATTRQIKSNKINGLHWNILSPDWKILWAKGSLSLPLTFSRASGPRNLMRAEPPGGIRAQKTGLRCDNRLALHRKCAWCDEALDTVRRLQMALPFRKLRRASSRVSSLSAEHR